MTSRSKYIEIVLVLQHPSSRQFAACMLAYTNNGISRGSSKSHVGKVNVDGQNCFSWGNNQTFRSLSFLVDFLCEELSFFRSGLVVGCSDLKPCMYMIVALLDMKK